MKCVYKPTGQPGEYRCLTCGHTRTSKYQAHQLHRECVTPGEEPTPGPIPSAEPTPEEGVGTELKKILESQGIVPVQNCGCERHAAEMNRRGPDWCAKHVPTIVEWLRAEAEARQMLFSDLAARFIIHLAIRRSRRKQKATTCKR